MLSHSTFVRQNDRDHAENADAVRAESTLLAASGLVASIDGATRMLGEVHDEIAENAIPLGNIIAAIEAQTEVIAEGVVALVRIADALEAGGR
jgi:inactivated superfamily I helicase